MNANQPKQSKSYYQDVLRKFCQHKLAMFGLTVLILEVIAILFIPWIFQLDPYQSVGSFNAAPSASHLLGTDSVGRDLLARVLHGGRISLYVGVTSAFISVIIGLPLGLIAGFFRGIPEMIIMRLADMFMSFPSMILILALAAALGPSVNVLTLILGFLGWPEIARLLYANVLSIKEKEYVESAVAIGTSTLDIMLKYIIPNGITPVLIAFTFRTAASILQESSLSFLGLGVPAPTASWGNIIYEAQSISVLSQRPWVWLPPGLLLLATVLSINFFGDGLRDALDTKTIIKSKKIKTRSKSISKRSFVNE